MSKYASTRHGDGKTNIGSFLEDPTRKIGIDIGFGIGSFRRRAKASSRVKTRSESGISQGIRFTIFRGKVWRNVKDGGIRVKSDRAHIQRMGKREKIDTSNMVSFRSIEVMRESSHGINCNFDRVDGHTESSPIIDERKIRMKAKIANKVFQSSKMDMCSVHLVLCKSNAGGHATLKDSAILKTKFMFSTLEIFLVERNGLSKGF
jgi:hypothetical protein